MIGRLLLSVLPPSISIRLLLRREVSSGEPELIRIRALSGEGVFLDIGANRGVYSRVANSAGFDVVALEPNPRLAQYIRRWSRGTVEVLEAVASSSSGNITLAIPINESGMESDGLASADIDRIRSQSRQIREIEVPALTVDGLGLSAVRFVKIDVEGHELDVLMGARQTLISCTPILQVEIEERHSSGAISRCSNLLAELGYSCYFVRQGLLLPLTEFSIEYDQDPSAVGDRSRYINNFYFIASQNQLAWLKKAVG
jgi:FkbM family methyltransferase